MLRAPARAFEGHEPEKKDKNILTPYLIRHEVHSYILHNQSIYVFNVSCKGKNWYVHMIFSTSQLHCTDMIVHVNLFLLYRCTDLT